MGGSTFAAMGRLTLLAAWLSYWRGGETAGPQDVPLKNPFSLTAAAQFAVVFAAVLLLVKVTQLLLPPRRRLHRGGPGRSHRRRRDHPVDSRIRQNQPADRRRHSVVIAAISNTLVKCGMVTTLGGPGLRRPMLLTAAGVMVAGIGGVAVMWPRQSS